MHVIHHSADRLFIRRRPWLLGGFLWVTGAMLFQAAVVDPALGGLDKRLLMLAGGAACLAVAWWVAPVVTLAFDRPEGTATLTHYRLFHRRRRVLSLSGLRRARLQSTLTEDGGRLTRLALDHGGEKIPVEIGYFSGDRTRIRATIIRWLEGEGPDDPLPPPSLSHGPI